MTCDACPALPDLVEARAHRKGEGKQGRDGLRRMSAISFHSLRHTATSLMKRQGIPAAVVQDIIGHDSEAISQSYTHIDEAMKRGALEQMPGYFG